jgi:hypothetical protein
LEAPRRSSPFSLNIFVGEIPKVLERCSISMIVEM